MQLSWVPTVVSYSDGEGFDAGVGIAIWKPGHETLAGYRRTPACVRRLWSRQREINGEHHDILEIEAIGPALVLSTWPEMLRGCLWLHFIDNENALAAVIKGGSSVHSADCIAAFVAGRTSELECWPWYDRVDTHADPVDGLSRKRLAGDWRLVPLKFPAALRASLEAYLDEPKPRMRATSRGPGSSDAA